MADDVAVEALSAAHAAPARFRRVGRSVPDHRLVARLRMGDEGAFEAIFDRYHRQLLAFCRHMLGSREEAEDALQHVFVSAHRHLVTRDEVIELRPWLYAIARNRCLSLLRARREALALDDVPEPSVDGLSVAAEVEQRQDLKEILGDLARLPDDQRAALVLSELGALSHDEIGGVLGVRRDKVKALVFQARESLAAYRSARDIDCRDIREQLATLSGGALRRGPLRKHLETCDGCRGFRDEVRHQREAMALLLPVVPTVALKAKVIGAVTAGSAAPLGAGAGAGAGVAGTALSAGVAGTGASTGLSAVGGSFVAKTLIVAAVAGTAGGGYAVVDEVTRSDPPAPPARVAPASESREAPASATPTSTVFTAPVTVESPARAGGRPAKVPGRGSAVPAERTAGRGKADAATPGVPGKPPAALDAPGQVKKDEATAQGSKPETAGSRPATTGKPESRPQRPAKSQDAPASRAPAEPPGKVKPEQSRADPDTPETTPPPASTNAAAPPAASSRPDDPGRPDQPGKPGKDTTGL